MRSHPIQRLFLITLVATVSTPLPLNFLALFAAPQVLAQTPDARKAEAERLLQQGVRQFRDNLFKAALQSWQQALTIYQAIKDREGESKTLVVLGVIYTLEGNYSQAIEDLQQSLVLAQSLKNREQELRVLSQMGLTYFSWGNYHQSIEYYQQSLVLAQSLKKPEEELKVLKNIGDAYSSLADYSKAIDSYQKSLAIAQNITNREEESEILQDLGKVYLTKGDNAKALDYYQQSLMLARQLGKEAEASAINELGDAYFFLGDYAQAIEYFQEALELAQSLQNQLSQILIVSNLGTAYYMLGEYNKAIEYYQKNLLVAQRTENRQRILIAQTLLVGAYISLKEPEKALEYARQNLTLAQEFQDLYLERSAFSHLSHIYILQGNYSRAIEYLHQSLAIAKQLNNKTLQAEDLTNLGNAYHYLGNLSKAIEYSQQGLAILRETIDNTSTKGLALENLALSLADSGNLIQAEVAARDSIEYFESQRRKLGNIDAYKVSFFEKQVDSYALLQQILVAQHKNNEALEIAERGRARVFVELLASRLAPTESTKASPPKIAQIQQIAKTQNATLVEYSIVSSDFKKQLRNKNSNLALYIWVVQPTGAISFRQADLKSLTTSLKDFITTSRESIGVRGRGITIAARPGMNQTQRLQQLYQILIEPIANLLPTDPNARVIFIPQGELFLVPFPALQDTAGKYLLEKHTILTAPSIQVLDLTHKQRQQVSGKDALVVGNPTMPSVPPALGQPPRQLPSLPGAEREAQAIAPLLATQPLIGNQATKAAIMPLLPKARIIHLATHGILDDIRGLGSAIALAPSANDNGLLTAEEILNLKLNAELVVLSACDTGRGRITGDGIVGLSRSLISAGVPSVIVSLWSVPDAPTASLMTEFYQNWQKYPDKAQALRQAMLKTKQQYPNPKDWAAFTLIGEAE